MVDLEKLSKFAAEFLGKKVTVHADSGKVWFDVNATTLFENIATAPILAHLALKEMEKRGYEWEGHGRKKICSYNFQKASSKYIPMDFEHDENYFIALWSAIEETGEKGGN